MRGEAEHNFQRANNQFLYTLGGQVYHSTQFNIYKQVLTSVHPKGGNVLRRGGMMRKFCDILIHFVNKQKTLIKVCFRFFVLLISCGKVI